MIALGDEPQRIMRLTPLASALAQIESLISPVAPGRVPLNDAHGAVLAESIRAREDAPAQALALRDGVAVSAAETQDASSYAPVPLPGAAAIEAGRPLPSGCDAVAGWELIDAEAQPPQIMAAVAPGDGVLLAAGDSRAGVELCRAGTRLTALPLAVLASLGHATVAVRQPRVGIAIARPDPILEAIAAWLSQRLRDLGAKPQRRDGIGPEADDLLLIAGGSGAGGRDASVRRLERSGRLLVHGLAIAPGATAALGLAGSLPVVVVPGRLDAAMAAMALLGEPVLARLADAAPERPVATATLTGKIASTIGLTEFVPVRCAAGEAEPLGTVYVPLGQIAKANGYVVVPADSEGYPAGTPVAVRSLS